MIKKLALPVLFLLGLFLLFGCEKKPVEKRGSILVVGLNANYPPYESYSLDGEIEGFDIDVAKALAEKLGLKLEIKDLSFDSLLVALKQEKIDLIMSGMSITPSRQKEIAMIPYQGEEVKQLALAFWKEVPPWFKSLGDLKTAAVQVGTYQEVYLRKSEGISIKALDGTTDLIMELQHGKSQAVLFEPHIAEAMRAKFPEIQLFTINLPQEEWVLGNGIGIKKERSLLIQQVTQAVHELKSEGWIHQMEEKWFGGKRDVH